MVLDTNVMVAANGHAPQASQDCRRRCIDEIERAMAGRQVLIDDRWLILAEYRRHLSPSGQPGVGDEFYRWVLTNRTNSLRCRQVSIAPQGDRGFAEFPEDADLARFDRADRKFVATVLASRESAPIINATDRRSWWVFREALARHGVQVDFLCPDLMDGSRG